MINGKYFDWEDIQIQGPQGILTGIDAIDYSDEQEVEEVYGKGGSPLGFGRGHWKGSGKLTLLREEYDRYVESLAANGNGFYDHDLFNIVVSYADDNSPVAVDLLKKCKFSKRDFKAKSGDKKLHVGLDFKIFGGIESDGQAHS